MDHSTQSLPVYHHSQSLSKLMFIESVIPSNHLILCRPLLLLPSIFPSIRVFSNKSALCIRCPDIISIIKYMCGIELDQLYSENKKEICENGVIIDRPVKRLISFLSEYVRLF